MKSSRAFALEESLSSRYVDLVHCKSTLGAECYRANDKSTGKSVFIKIVNSLRYRREVRSLTLEDDRYLLLPIDTFYKDKENCALIYPWIAGGNLRALLSKMSQLEPDLAETLAHDLLSGLRLLNQHGLVHLDIKPENIQCQKGPDGRFRFMIADFGSMASCTELASASWRGATPAYEAPESISGRPGTQTDLYSIGIVIYEALAGRPPYQGMPKQIFFQAMHEFPSLHFIKHPPLRRLVVNLLQKHPMNRPSDAEAALRLLHQEPERITPSLPASRHTLVPSIRLNDVMIRNRRYDWIACDDFGEYIAFSMNNWLAVYDWRHRFGGMIYWHGVKPIWHGSQLWYLVGCDLYHWSLTQNKREFAGALGFVPDAFDVDDRNIVWTAEGHLMRVERGEDLSAPLMKKLMGYLKPTNLMVADNSILVVAGKLANELFCFSLALKHQWSLQMDGIVREVKLQINGYILVLVQEFSRKYEWVLVTFKGDPTPVSLALPGGISRVTLTAAGALVWTGKGMLLFKATDRGFEIDDWKPAALRRGQRRISAKYR